MAVLCCVCLRFELEQEFVVVGEECSVLNDAVLFKFRFRVEQNAFCFVELIFIISKLFCAKDIFPPFFSLEYIVVIHSCIVVF